MGLFDDYADDVKGAVPEGRDITAFAEIMDAKTQMRVATKGHVLVSCKRYDLEQILGRPPRVGDLVMFMGQLCEITFEPAIIVHQGCLTDRVALQIKTRSSMETPDLWFPTKRGL